MTYPILCPKCDSDEIKQTPEGELECQKCSFRFHVTFLIAGYTQAILTELKRLAALLTKLIHQRRGVSDIEKDQILSILRTARKRLDTSDIMAILNVSRDTALRIMRSIASEDLGIKYLAGQGNRPSRLGLHPLTETSS